VLGVGPPERGASPEVSAAHDAGMGMFAPRRTPIC